MITDKKYSTEEERKANDFRWRWILSDNKEEKNKICPIRRRK